MIDARMDETFPWWGAMNDIVNELRTNPETLAGARQLADTLAKGQAGSQLGHSSSAKKLRIWLTVRQEIHVLLCSSSPVYEEQRKMINVSGVALVSALSAALAMKIGMAATALGPIISVLLYVPLAIGVNAWCKEFSASSRELTRNELTVVKDLVQK